MPHPRPGTRPKVPCRALVFLAVLFSATAAGAAAPADAQDPNSPLLWVDTRDVPLPEARPVLFGESPVARLGRLGLDVLVHVGALVPHGELYRHAHAGVSFGAGLAAEWRFDARSAARLGVTYAHAQLTSKVEGLTGPVRLDAVLFRGDYVFGSRWWRPWVGGSVGVVPWTGAIAQPAAARVNEGKGTPFAGGGALGVDLHVLPHLALTPEVSWTGIAGGFRASLWGAGLALKGRI